MHEIDTVICCLLVNWEYHSIADYEDASIVGAMGDLVIAAYEFNAAVKQLVSEALTNTVEKPCYKTFPLCLVLYGNDINLTALDMLNLLDERTG